MGFFQPNDDEECNHFELECDVCHDTIAGDVVDLLETGWLWLKLEGHSTEKRSVVHYYSIITLATCPKHVHRIEDLLLNEMYSLEEYPPIG